jgi:hypothetical protein
MNSSQSLLAGMALAIAVGCGMPPRTDAADRANPRMLVSPATLNALLAREDVAVIDVRPKQGLRRPPHPKAAPGQ